MQNLQLFSFFDIPVIGQVRADQGGADHRCFTHLVHLQYPSLTSVGCTGLHALQVCCPDPLTMLMPTFLAAVWPAYESCTAEQPCQGHSVQAQSPQRSSSSICVTYLGVRCCLSRTLLDLRRSLSGVLLRSLLMQIAFSSISTALKLYCEDRKSGSSVVHHGQIQKQPGSAPGVGERHRWWANVLRSISGG